jgi:hypothetical protein
MKKITIGLTILVAVLVVAAFTNEYYITDGAGATLFWKGDETVLFLGTSSSGYHFKFIEYPAVALRAYFNAPMPPSVARVSTTVVRVTPLVVVRYHLNYGKDTVNAPEFLTPFDDGFYAMCTGLALCKWAGNRFDPATEEEVRRLNGISHLYHGDMNNQIVNGWSVRQLPRSPHSHFEIEIADSYSIYARDLASTAREQPRISVDLRRPGKPPESLYSVDGTPRRVSRTEYKNLFGEP